jgi:hypothetical protein
MTTDWKLLETADDVNPAILDMVTECVDWFPDEEPMPTDDFIDRLCKTYLNRYYVDVEHLDTPAVRKIMRHAREVRAS